MIINKIKYLIHWVTSFLSMVSIIFVAIKLYEYNEQIDISQFTAWNISIFIILVLVYAAINMFLVVAWKELLRQFDVDVSISWATRIYGVTQLAKYIPGNIFQLAGRQLKAQEAGLPAWSVAKSILWELGLLCGTGALFSILIIPKYFQLISEPLALMIFICVLSISVIGVMKFISIQIARSLACYAGFLVISGVIFVCIVSVVLKDTHLCIYQMISICASFIVAWLIGLVTPGSPAGVGIREVVLMALLNNLASEEIILLFAILGRVITVSGDILFFILASRVKGDSVI